MKTLMTHLVALALMGLVLGGNVAQAGDLHFTEFGRYAVADPHPPAAGDMNNDGNIDLVVPGYDNDITVMLGDGTGALKSGMIVSQGGYREVTAVVGYFDAGRWHGVSFRIRKLLGGLLSPRHHQRVFQ